MLITLILEEKIIHHNLEDCKCDKCGSMISELKPTEIKVLKYIPEKTILKNIFFIITYVIVVLKKVILLCLKLLKAQKLADYSTKVLSLLN